MDIMFFDEDYDSIDDMDEEESMSLFGPLFEPDSWDDEVND